MPQSLSTELYQLIIGELDEDSLLQCSKVCRVLWHLSRPHLFEDILVEHRYQRNSTSANLLMELIQDEQYSILGFISYFQVEFINPPERDEIFPPPNDPILSVFDALCNAPKLESIYVGSKLPLWWGRILPSLRTSLRALCRSPKTVDLSLHRLMDLPADILQDAHLQKLEIVNCRVHYTWWKNPVKFNALRLTELTMDNSFPVLSIYSLPTSLTSDGENGPLPYVGFKEYRSKIISRDSLREEMEILKRSSSSLECPSLTFHGVFGDPEKEDLEPNEITPVFDLGEFKNLKEFEFYYRRPSDCIEEPGSDLVVFCEKFLQVTRPIPSLESITIDITVFDEPCNLFNISDSVERYWHVLDNALTHEYLTKAKVDFKVVYCLLGRALFVDMSEIPPYVQHRLTYLFPNLVAKDPDSVWVDIRHK